MALRRALWIGSPVKTAMVVAVLAPLSPWWGWPVLGVLLVSTWSWLAFAAVAAGFTVRMPSVGLPLLSVGGPLVAVLWWWNPRLGPRRLLEWTPRGDSLDSIRGRLAGIALAYLRWSWRGHGPGSMRRDLRRWSSRGVVYLPTDALFCEPVQLCYEYGLLGALGLGLAVVSAALIVEWGSPVSAVLVSYAVLSLGHAPLHYVRTWAARQFRRLVPGEPLLLDVTIHVLADGTFRLYTEHQRVHTLNEAAVIAAAIIRAGTWIAGKHGLHIEQIGSASEEGRFHA